MPVTPQSPNSENNLMYLIQTLVLTLTNARNPHDKNNCQSNPSKNRHL